jgi:folate-binding protein YgfZ
MQAQQPAASLLPATPLLEQHKAAGAEMGEYFGVHLPARFGEFEAEYHAARSACVLVDTNFKAIFGFSGLDRNRYLNAILTSNVRDLQPGQGALGLLLTPQGHIVAEIETYPLADRILAVTHAVARERAFSTLEKFIIMDDVTLEDITSATGTLALVGPRTSETISQVSGVDLSSLPAFSHTVATIGSIPSRIVHHTLGNLPAATLIVGREHLAALWAVLEPALREHGGAPAGLEALNSLRLESGIAWFGNDFDEKVIPHEAGLERSHINYEKGCYTGQEIVERVRSRGHVNRRLTGLKFPSGIRPAPGAKLTAAGSEAGHVTSTAFSPLLGCPIGLGYLRREYAIVGTALDASDAPAEVVSLPLQV